MLFDIQSYKRSPNKKQEVIRQFKSKINDSPDLNTSQFSSSNRNDTGVKAKIEDFFMTQKKMNSIIDPHQSNSRSFLRGPTLTTESIKSRQASAKRKAKFEDMINNYFSGLQMTSNENNEPSLIPVNKRPIEEDRSIRRSPPKAKPFSGRVGKSPIMAFKEQYDNDRQQSTRKTKGSTTSNFPLERSFLTKPLPKLKKITSNYKFNIENIMPSSSSRLLQYENTSKKLTYSEIQYFQERFDSLSDEELADLPNK